MADSHEVDDKARVEDRNRLRASIDQAVVGKKSMNILIAADSTSSNDKDESNGNSIKDGSIASMRFENSSSESFEDEKPRSTTDADIAKQHSGIHKYYLSDHPAPGEPPYGPIVPQHEAAKGIGHMHWLHAEGRMTEQELKNAARAAFASRNKADPKDN